MQLEELKLSDKPIRIRGSYTNTDAPGLPPKVSVEYNALQRLVALFDQKFLLNFVMSGSGIELRTLWFVGAEYSTYRPLRAW